MILTLKNWVSIHFSFFDDMLYWKESIHTMNWFIVNKGDAWNLMYHDTRYTVFKNRNINMTRCSPNATLQFASVQMILPLQDRLPWRLPEELDRARRAVLGLRHRGVRRRQAEGRVPSRVEQVPQREEFGGQNWVDLKLFVLRRAMFKNVICFCMLVNCDNYDKNY